MFHLPNQPKANEAEWPPIIDELIQAGTPPIIAYNISGGKDGTAAALACEEKIKQRGLENIITRVAIHSHLGKIEHEDSLPSCRRVADRLNLPLIVVDAPDDGMIGIWKKRWRNNIKRYQELRCMTLIMPWSSAAMRFCTRAAKAQPIAQELVRRYPGKTIICVTGIRKDESSRRAKAQLIKEDSLLTRKKVKTIGYLWNPIRHWSVADVWAIHKAWQLRGHFAYIALKMSRVSCSACILSNQDDLQKSMRHPGNQHVLHTLTTMEIESGFAFQQGKWLADIAPELLTEDEKAGIKTAKEKAALREKIEAEIPKHLLYQEGWPTAIPSLDEAKIISSVRNKIASLMNIPIDYTDPQDIIDRFAQLMEEQRKTEEKKQKKGKGAADPKKRKVFQTAFTF